MRASVPNALSLSRVGFGLVIVSVAGNLTAATYAVTLCSACLAMITDILDGRLARRWGVTSRLGYILDGLGDRAFHAAMVLVFLVRYELLPLLVWLLVFRDIALYAIRVLTPDWSDIARRGRAVTYVHVGALRIWIAMFLIRDGVRVTTGSDGLNSFAFEAVQETLVWAAVVLSYYGLFRSFGRLLEQDYER